jgi:hypothetical protein
MSIDQAKKSVLSLSLAQITAQQHKISPEMAMMQETRRKLDVMAQSSFAQKIVDYLHSSSCSAIVGPQMVRCWVHRLEAEVVES